jgi:hypothetical protein
MVNHDPELCGLDDGGPGSDCPGCRAEAAERNGYAEPKPSNGDGKPGVNGELWEPPLPLGECHDLPAFPVDCLPQWKGQWVTSEAEATQTPPDLPAMLALSIAGAGIAKRVRVEVRPGWQEPVNICCVTALPVGDRKSQDFRDAMAPVIEAERQERLRMAPLIAKAKAEHRVWEKRLKHLEDKAAKAEGQEKEKLMKDLKDAACEEHIIPTEPKFFCDDVTPEKLTGLLEAQGGRMLVASAEGTIIEIIKGRYSDSPNFDVFLKGHAGDPLRSGRISRADEEEDQPALSLALAVQPDVIRGMAEHATMKARGLLARILFSIPVSKVGSRKIRPLAVPEVIANRYRDNMLALWQFQETVVMKFSREADKALEEFERWLEPLLSPTGELSYLAGWANKLAGAIARIAAILQAAGAVGENRAIEGEIDLEVVRNAIKIGKEYLLPHAKAAFQVMGADEALEDAKRVVHSLKSPKFREKVKTEKGGIVSQRDIHAHVFGGSRRTEEVERVVELLEKYGYLRPIQEQARHGRGRNPSCRFEVNPKIPGPGEKDGTLSQKSQNSQKSEPKGVFEGEV